MADDIKAPYFVVGGSNGAALTDEQVSALARQLGGHTGELGVRQIRRGNSWGWHADDGKATVIWSHGTDDVLEHFRQEVARRDDLEILEEHNMP